MDATTNWAVVSTAAIVTFAFSRPDSPHFVLLLAVVFGVFFLVMEARRYQRFHMWRRRVHDMNRWIIVPALSPELAPSADEIEAALTELANDLASSVPRVSVFDAIGYRIRRSYGFLFAAVTASWLLKISHHPTPVSSTSEFLERAAVGFLPGMAVLTFAGVATGVAIILASVASSEQMEDWTEVGSPLERALKVAENSRD